MSMQCVRRVSQSALLCGVLFAAADAAWAADESRAADTAPPLGQQVIALLQRTAKALESGTVEPAEEADFRALVAISETLKTDRTLVPGERVRLEALVRIRLRHAAEA